MPAVRSFACAAIPSAPHFLPSPHSLPTPHAPPPTPRAPPPTPRAPPPPPPPTHPADVEAIAAEVVGGVVGVLHRKQEGALVLRVAGWVGGWVRQEEGRWGRWRDRQKQCSAPPSTSNRALSIHILSNATTTHTPCPPRTAPHTARTAPATHLKESLAALVEEAAAPAAAHPHLHMQASKHEAHQRRRRQSVVTHRAGGACAAACYRSQGGMWAHHCI